MNDYQKELKKSRRKRIAIIIIIVVLVVALLLALGFIAFVFSLQNSFEGVEFQMSIPEEDVRDFIVDSFEAFIPTRQ